MEDGFPDEERADPSLPGLGSPHCFPHQNGERVERYSRKVFVGGLPPDIDEGIEHIYTIFWSTLYERFQGSMLTLGTLRLSL